MKSNKETPTNKPQAPEIRLIRMDKGFYKLESLVFALVGSLVYMVVLVAYVKSNFNLTLDVRDELVIGFWLVIIGIMYTVLECFTRRCPNNTTKETK